MMYGCLRPLVVGDRVAHREDTFWEGGDGEVIAVLHDDLYRVQWPDIAEVNDHPRLDLVAEDDPDVSATDERPLNVDGRTMIEPTCIMARDEEGIADVCPVHGDPWPCRTGIDAYEATL